jgi:hypothetical protein
MIALPLGSILSCFAAPCTLTLALHDSSRNHTAVGECQKVSSPGAEKQPTFNPQARL